VRDEEEDIEMTTPRRVWLALVLVGLVPASLFACEEDDGTPVTEADASTPETSVDGSTPDVITPDVVTETDAGDDSGGESYFVQITSPMNGETVTLPPDGKLPIVFATNLNLWTARSCADGGPPGNCGHAHLRIDGNTCNAPRTLPDGGATKQTYNVSVEEPSPTYADFFFCPPPVAGQHVIDLELRQDNHAPRNPVVNHTITVNVVEPDGGIVRDGG
jgi:hypothetical protein